MDEEHAVATHGPGTRCLPPGPPLIKPCGTMPIQFDHDLSFEDSMEKFGRALANRNGDVSLVIHDQRIYTMDQLGPGTQWELIRRADEALINSLSTIDEERATHGPGTRCWSPAKVKAEAKRRHEDHVTYKRMMTAAKRYSAHHKAVDRERADLN